MYTNIESRHSNIKKTFEGKLEIEIRVIINYNFDLKKRVYASPSRRDLKSKGTEETITYPNIYFMIDDFEDVSFLFYNSIENDC